MAKHLLEHTLPAEQMKVAEYYAGGQGTGEALAQGMGCVPTPRADMHPDLAAALGIKPGRMLNEEELANVLGGCRADGTKLPVQHQHRDVRVYRAQPGEGGEVAGKDRVRISYMDLTFSAPKSVSLAWAFAETDAERNSILQAHRDARDATLRYIEGEIAWGRRGDGGRDGDERGHLAWITADHFTSRPTVAVTRPDPVTGVVDTELHTLKVAGDPQLHTHCIMPNLMVTQSGRVVSINRDLFDGRIHEFGAVYQALLAKELLAIGAEVVLCERTLMAKLPAIPDEVAEEFSKRTRDAEGAARAEAERRGLDWEAMSPDSRVDFLKGGAHATRQGKGDDLSDMAAWRVQAARLGWKHNSVIAYAPPAPRRSEAERMAHADQVAAPLLADALSKRAVIGGGDVRLAAARGFIAAGIESTDDIGALTRAWARDGVQQDGRRTGLLWRQVDKHRVRITTELHRDQETELISLARGAAADRTLSLAPGEIAAAVARSGLAYDGAHGQMQRHAVETLGKDGSFGVVIGVAGTGKTTRVLPPLVAAWQARGYEVWGTALAWRQANALQEAGIAASNTRALQPFLDGVEAGTTKLGQCSVVVLDELGQVGTRQLLHLLRLREQHGFKVVATGDDRQNQSIEAGPVIELLRRALGKERIPEILSTVRQKTEEERHIAGLFRAGEAGRAIQLKVANGSAELVEGGYREAVRRVAALYRERREANRGDPAYTVTISAPTNADAREISRAVRDERRAMGELGHDRVTVRATDGRGGAFALPLADGDSVRLFARTRGVFTDGQGRRKSASIGDNGTVLRVVKVLPAEGLELRGESGKVGFVSWDALRDREGTGRIRLTYGDAGTIDSSQGITSDEHINALPAGSKAAQGFSAYVAESRHRVQSWMVGSMGAEMREALTRRPMGLPAPETAEERRREAWANVTRNLERQSLKESALTFLEGATVETKQAARSLQAGLRKSEARAAAGEQATTLRRTFGERKARQALPRVMEQLDEAARQRAPVMARIAALSPKEVVPKAPRRAAAAGTPRTQRNRKAVCAGPKLPQQKPAKVAREARPMQVAPKAPRRAATAGTSRTQRNRKAVCAGPKLPQQEPAQVARPVQVAPAPLAGQEARAPRVKTPAPRPAQARRVEIGEWEAQQQFADAMRAHGLKPQGLPILDGTLRYVAVEGNKGREKSGAYRGFYDEGWPAGAIYNWKQGGFVGTWKAEGEMVPVSAADQAALAARAEAQAAERERERVAREGAGARLAVQLLAGARLADASHPYLAAKGIEAYGLSLAVQGQTVPVSGKPLGLTQDAKGTTRNASIAGRLLVPLHDVDGEVRNVQTIAADGTKLYLGGAQKMGTFHLLGELRAGSPVIVAEGYATGATVHRATGLAVAVALDTSNLMAVATALRDQDPARPIYMAADNDHHLPLRAKPLPNAGREKAEAAAAAVGGKVLLPEAVPGQVAKGKGTDWNDYEASHGRAATRAALGTAGLQELVAQDALLAARSRAAERQGVGLSA
jgi:phage/plasmid primase-like uncharacterized protein